MGQRHFINEGSLERKRRGKGLDQTKSRLLAFPKVRRWLRSGWWVSRGFLPHSCTRPHLPPWSKKSIDQSYTSRMCLLAAHQLHHWQPDHLWAPGILAVTCLHTLSQPLPWPMATIVILFRDASGDKKQAKTNGQPSCGPVSEAEYLYIALPEQVCCRSSRRPWPIQTTGERWTLSGISWTPVYFKPTAQSQCDFMNQGKTL